MRRSAAPSSRLGLGPRLQATGNDENVALQAPVLSRSSFQFAKATSSFKAVQDTTKSSPSGGGDTPSKPIARSTASILSLIGQAGTSTDNAQTQDVDQTEVACDRQSQAASVRNLNSLSSRVASVGQVQRQTSSSSPAPTKDSTPATEKRIFSVVWGKQSTKKHKTWEGDGTLELGEKTATLKDEDGKILGKATQVKTAELEEGSRLKVGSKEVELIDLLSGPAKSVKPAETSSKRPANEPAETSGKTAWKKPKKKAAPLNIKFTAEGCDPLIMPVPSHDHQWSFNAKKLPVTEVVVDSFLTRVLRPHQREGVIFLYECVFGMRNTNYRGAILADEMGLGKTLQTITLIWTLLRQGPYGGLPVVHRVLVVSPSSLVLNWQKEFDRWLGSHRLRTFAVDQKNKVTEFARLSHIPVMLVSYEMLMRNFDDISKIRFDLLVCDEGHRLKNNNIRTSVLLSQLDVKARVLLTGTPIQNDLQEFYALVNFVNPGILSSPAEFRKRYEEPIVASRQPKCPSGVRQYGEERAVALSSKTSCFILRRTQTVINKYLPTKIESVLFIKPTDIQQSLCRLCLDWWENRDRSPGMNDGSVHLGIMTMLKKICNHPGLIRVAEISEGDDPDVQLLSQSDLPQELTELYNDYEGGAVAVHHSAKLTVVRRLLEDMMSVRERVVLVSYFTQTLDLLGALCDEMCLSYTRLDGSTPSGQRTQIVDQFNAAFSKHVVFLLSARAGGVGLNLTGASRLVLFDSDWNPATDAQAMSRVWRDGQKKSVYIYRLLTCGTIEEKIFQRQLSKTGLSGAVVDPQSRSNIKLSNEELKDLFTFYNGSESLTHKSLGCNCDGSGGVPLLEDFPSSSRSDDKENEFEDSDRDCQLHIGLTPSGASRKSSSASTDVRMNELFKWQHHAPPFSDDVLQGMGLSNASKLLAFMFVAPPTVQSSD